MTSALWPDYPRISIPHFQYPHVCSPYQLLPLSLPHYYTILKCKHVQNEMILREQCPLNARRMYTHCPYYFSMHKISHFPSDFRHKENLMFTPAGKCPSLYNILRNLCLRSKVGIYLSLPKFHIYFLTENLKYSHDSKFLSKCLTLHSHFTVHPNFDFLNSKFQVKIFNLSTAF